MVEDVEVEEVLVRSAVTAVTAVVTVVRGRTHFHTPLSLRTNSLLNFQTEKLLEVRRGTTETETTGVDITGKSRDGRRRRENDRRGEETTTSNAGGKRLTGGHNLLEMDTIYDEMDDEE